MGADAIVGSTASSIADKNHRELGRLIWQSGLKIDKKIMNYEVASLNSRGQNGTTDIGVQKRQGALQSHLLKLKHGSHHLRSCGYLARLLPTGDTAKLSKTLGNGIKKFWGVFNNQKSMVDGQNVYEFCHKVADYFDASPTIQDDTIIVLYEVGLRHYDESKGLHGVKTIRITYKQWKNKWLDMANSRLQMAKNAQVAAETRRQAKQRKADKVEDETKPLAERMAKLLEMAKKPSVSAERVRAEVIKAEDLISRELVKDKG